MAVHGTEGLATRVVQRTFWSYPATQMGRCLASSLRPAQLEHRSKFFWFDILLTMPKAAKKSTKKAAKKPKATKKTTKKKAAKKASPKK